MPIVRKMRRAGIPRQPEALLAVTLSRRRMAIPRRRDSNNILTPDVV
jgi:hypothetical protein